MQPSEPEEEVKELVAREGVRKAEHDPEFEQAEIWRREEAPPGDDRPDADWLQSSGWWFVFGAIAVALVAWILYLVLA
jgi:hypothetical protein